jgi:hypothetical protein
MLKLKQKLAAGVIIGFLAVGACGQKPEKGDKRPPKPDNRVVVKPKDRGERPPPPNNNSNQGGKKDDKKGRP